MLNKRNSDFACAFIAVFEFATASRVQPFIGPHMQGTRSPGSAVAGKLQPDGAVLIHDSVNNGWKPFDRGSVNVTKSVLIEM